MVRRASLVILKPASGTSVSPKRLTGRLEYHSTDASTAIIPRRRLLSVEFEDSYYRETQAKVCKRTMREVGLALVWTHTQPWTSQHAQPLDHVHSKFEGYAYQWSAPTKVYVVSSWCLSYMYCPLLSVVVPAAFLFYCWYITICSVTATV